MYANQQFQSRPGGPTGSVHRFGVSGSNGQSGMGGQTDKKWGDTTSKAGEISRVFVGNVEHKSTVCNDMEQIFSKYGTIKGIDINPNGFAFIQFERVEEAQKACQFVSGYLFNNRKLDVRPFDKTGHPVKGRQNQNQNRDRSRSPLPRQAGAMRPTGGPTGTRRGGMNPNMNQFDDFGYPPPPSEPVVGNEAEIIVVTKDQWSYADMIEKRIKRETGIQLIDMLFLHSPASLNMTLNDLFERRTLYALVVAPVNEEHTSVTLHVLHNQTEHRNMPLEDALLLISKDFQAFTGRPGPLPPVPASVPELPFSGDFKDGYNRSDISDTKLPEEISYLLRNILQENGPQFLSTIQLDLLIDYFQRQKTRLTAKTSGQLSQPIQQEVDKQKANLLDNPHVQAALSSLLQIGALGSTSNTENNSMTSQSNPQSNSLYQMNAQFAPQLQNNSSNAQTRRHPLLGTEVAPNASQMSIPGAPGGLVRYPPPQSYSQYSYQF